MVCDAPTIDAVLPMFLEFARGAVLVAHNAGFDIGFLRAAAERCEHRLAAPAGAVHGPAGPAGAEPRRGARACGWPRWPGCSAAATQPTHRALDDARATVDVLHALIERVGNQGVHTYTDLRVVPARRLPPNATQAGSGRATCRTGPGCTCSAGPTGEVLYVGTAIDLRRRVGQYFNGADPRGRA